MAETADPTARQPATAATYNIPDPIVLIALVLLLAATAALAALGTWRTVCACRAFGARALATLREKLTRTPAQHHTDASKATDDTHPTDTARVNTGKGANEPPTETATTTAPVLNPPHETHATKRNMAEQEPYMNISLILRTHDGDDKGIVIDRKSIPHAALALPATYWPSALNEFLKKCVQTLYNTDRLMVNHVRVNRMKKLPLAAVLETGSEAEAALKTHIVKSLASRRDHAAVIATLSSSAAAFSPSPPSGMSTERLPSEGARAAPAAHTPANAARAALAAHPPINVNIGNNSTAAFNFGTGNVTVAPTPGNAMRRTDVRPTDDTHRTLGAPMSNDNSVPPRAAGGDARHTKHPSGPAAPTATSNRIARDTGDPSPHPSTLPAKRNVNTGTPPAAVPPAAARSAPPPHVNAAIHAGATAGAVSRTAAGGAGHAPPAAAAGGTPPPLPPADDAATSTADGAIKLPFIKYTDIGIVNPDGTPGTASEVAIEWVATRGPVTLLASLAASLHDVNSRLFSASGAGAACMINAVTMAVYGMQSVGLSTTIAHVLGAVLKAEGAYASLKDTARLLSSLICHDIESITSANLTAWSTRLYEGDPSWGELPVLALLAFLEGVCIQVYLLTHKSAREWRGGRTPEPDVVINRYAVMDKPEASATKTIRLVLHNNHFYWIADAKALAKHFNKKPKLPSDVAAAQADLAKHGPSHFARVTQLGRGIGNLAALINLDAKTMRRLVGEYMAKNLHDMRFGNEAITILANRIPSLATALDPEGEVTDITPLRGEVALAGAAGLPPASSTAGPGTAAGAAAGPGTAAGAAAGAAAAAAGAAAAAAAAAASAVAAAAVPGASGSTSSSRRTSISSESSAPTTLRSHAATDGSAARRSYAETAAAAPAASAAGAAAAAPAAAPRIIPRTRSSIAAAEAAASAAAVAPSAGAATRVASAAGAAAPAAAAAAAPAAAAAAAPGASDAAHPAAAGALSTGAPPTASLRA
jgi:hypothetical protein